MARLERPWSHTRHSDNSPLHPNEEQQSSQRFPMRRHSRGIPQHPFSWMSLLVVLLLAGFSINAVPTAFAATAVSQHQATPHVAADCNWYQPSAVTDIWDVGTGTVLGQVSVLANGCGSVELSMNVWVYGGVINHLELHRASDGAILEYGDRSLGTSAPMYTGHTQVYALGVIQDPLYHYWGLMTTNFTTGYITHPW